MLPGYWYKNSDAALSSMIAGYSIRYENGGAQGRRHFQFYDPLF